MTVARAETWGNEDISAILRVIMRAAMSLRQMVGEDVVGSDYQVFVVQAGEPFAPGTMVDEYAPEKRAERAGVQTLGSLSLGLIRHEGGSAAGSGEKDGVKILVKPQVVLQTIADDLGL